MKEPTPSWLSNVYNISSSSSLLSFKLYSPPLQQLFYSGAVLSASQMGGPKRHHHPTSGELFLARVFLSSFVFFLHSFFFFFLAEAFSAEVYKQEAPTLDRILRDGIAAITALVSIYIIRYYMYTNGNRWCLTALFCYAIVPLLLYTACSFITFVAQLPFIQSGRKKTWEYI